MDLSLKKLPWYTQAGALVALAICGVGAFYYLHAAPAIAVHHTAHRAESGEGVVNQSIAVAATLIAVNVPSHGFRRPAWSAMAPSTGADTAASKPEMARARPQSAAPCSGDAATARAKYAGKMNVTMMVENEEFAQSYRHQAKSATPM
jgi:hypothetical protein